MLVRLQKFLADAGVASRRASEAIIRARRVTVNGEILDQLGARVDAERDRVAVDGRPVKPKRKLYLALNKPSGYVTTRSDESNRRTVLDLLPKEWGHLFPVGRLDFETEGLLFLTNDGDFSLRVTHPRYEVAKTYRALVAGRVDRELLERLTKGVHQGGDRLRAQKARLISAGNSRSVVEVVLTEGKYREVRRMFEALERDVLHLKRTQIGPIKLRELPSGKWRTLTEPEIRSLLSKS
jgi:23S rRNA pseudouridine2605 synthase